MNMKFARINLFNKLYMYTVIYSFKTRLFKLKKKQNNFKHVKFGEHIFITNKSIVENLADKL